VAAEDGRANHPLIRRLRREAPSFSFFQAVRQVQALFPDAPRVGEQGPTHKEVLRFTGHLAFDFPPCDVTSVELDEREAPDDDGPLARLVMATTFLGLYGTSSPLPSSYTEDLFDQEPDSLERGFYDLFQHRLLSLFYRAWERYRYSIRFRSDGEDYYSRRLSCLLHVQRDLLPPDHRIGMLSLFAFAGLLSQEPRSAASLLAALRTEIPGTRFTVEPFVGRWLPIPAPQRSRLGVGPCRLGEDSLVGETILDRSSTFRVVVDAADFGEYVRFLPGGDLLVKARELIDLFNTDYLDYQVEVRLAEDAVPEPRLGSGTPLLGWSTWLGEPAPAARRVRILFEGALHGGG